MVDQNVNWSALSLSRFLLAFVVLVDHLQNFSDIGYLKYYSYLGSFEAILGFLLISGYSIGISISKNQKNYIIRRIKRIYPVYLVSIVYQLLVIGFPNTNSAFTLILNLLFLNQVFINWSFVGPAWTLATEVWLYITAPFLLKLRQKHVYCLILGSFICYLIYTCGRTLFHWDYYAATNYGINIVLLSFIWIAGFSLAIFPKKKA